MNRAITGAVGFVLLSSHLMGQPESTSRSFEVASVKLHPDPPQIINISTSGPRFRAEAEFVRGLIMYAYDLKNYQLPDSPAYAAVGDTMYDIVAKAEGDGEPTKAEFRQMLQSLLADRFKLKLHREQREIPVYVLVVGKTGPKFKESAADAKTSGHIGVNGRNQVMTLTKTTMEGVAGDLQIYVDRPVVDKTGLTGTYDIKLEATPFFRLTRNPDIPSDPADIDGFTAVQQQLGLKMEAQKAMMEVLVIDHVEKPSEN